MMALNKVSSNKIFGGFQQVFSHESIELGCKMNFGIYLPPKAESTKVPVIYWLSGLTCTEQNFITKSGFQQFAAQHGVVVVAPDTSPRGCNISGEDESWDFGTGAGFYLDATEEKWKAHYRMYTYVTKELPPLIEANFPVESGSRSIMGHSMGGHGALICHLKNPGMYKSVSAMAPICNPSQCPWGQKAFTGYLGKDQTSWMKYDACELVKSYSGPPVEILVDQSAWGFTGQRMFDDSMTVGHFLVCANGSADDFLEKGQLLPKNFVAACADAKVPVVLRMQDGYDHGYYFISTFIGDHIAYHARFLNP